MTNVFLKPWHVGISVENLSETVEWYKRYLDFQLVKVEEVPSLDATVAFIKHGDFEFEIFQHHQAIALPEERRYPNRDIITQGTKHICFRVEHLASLVDLLKMRGADIALEPMEMSQGTWVSFIRDNNGILIELMECRA